MDGDAVIAAGALGQSGPFPLLLDYPLTVGSAGHQLVGARTSEPVEIPKHPRPWRKGRQKRSVAPGLATVRAHLHPRNAAVPGEGYAVQASPPYSQHVACGGNGDEGSRLDSRLLVPAALLPIAEVLLLDEGDASEPLGMFHAVLTRRDHAQREAMGGGQ